MGEVTLSVAGRDYAIACRDGEETHLKRLGDVLRRHEGAALRGSGGLDRERTLLYIALMLADQLDESERNPSNGVSPVLLENIADRLEALAAALEEDAAAS